MKNRNLVLSFWVLQALVIVAFQIYDFASVELNEIIQFRKLGDLSTWKITHQVSLVTWVGGWLILVLGSLFGIYLNWYDSNGSMVKHVGFAIFFAPVMVVIIAMIFQTL